MTSVRIFITRDKPGLYEWAVLFDQEILASDIGDTSISECLASAGSALPDDQQSVEISYRGVPVGSFTSLDLQAVPEYVAEQITAHYADEQNS
jgi:hypothetical protein